MKDPPPIYGLSWSADDQRAREEHLRSFGHWAYRFIGKQLALPPDKRLRCWRKQDRSRVTEVDAKISWRAIDETQVKNGFAGDGVHFEENWADPDEDVAVSHWDLWGDPVDGTRQFKKRRKTPFRTRAQRPLLTEHSQVAVMLTYTFRGQPRAFYTGFPLQEGEFAGSLENGITLNGKPYKVPKNKSRLFVGVNEGQHEKRIREVTGLDRVTMANPLVRLILLGETAGGLNPFSLPHEATNIAAAARAVGAITTDRYGDPWRVGEHPERAPLLVWSMPGQDHNELLQLARLQRRF